MSSDSPDESANRFFRFIKDRIPVLMGDGHREGQARDIAMLEWRVQQWPPEWSDFLQVVIFGDFQPPEQTLSFPSLGITVEPENLKGTIIRSAFTVLNAKATVDGKTVASLLDAAARIDTFLSTWAALGWGNSGSGWWCHVFHGSIAGVMPSIPSDKSEAVIKAIGELGSKVRPKILSALYWIREPRQMSMEGYRSDVLRVFAGYWNAFECLVEAVCLSRSVSKLTRQEKQEAINKLVAGRLLDAAIITECYLGIVNTGFIGKATHALNICFGKRASLYVEQCFRAEPRSDRLYQIRNDIDHGSIDGNNVYELSRVENRHRLLWEIVFIMLGHFIPTDRPMPSLN